MDTRYDAIVIGLGAMGSASVFQLAKRGLRVLGIDRFAPPHQHGSTNGAVRIIRLAIGEGGHYTPLAKRSYEIFGEIERESGAKLLETTGMLTISRVDKNTIVPEGDFFDNTVSAACEFDIRHDVLDARALRARFPQFKVQDDERGYFEYDAGFLRPEECVKAQLSLARKYGADLLINENVSGFQADRTGVSVETEFGQYRARQLILSTGPWVKELIPCQYAHAFKVYRLVRCWFDVSSHYDNFKSTKFPIFFWQHSGVDRWIFGFPALDGPLGGISLSAADHTAPVEPDAVLRSVLPCEIKTLYDDYVSGRLENVGRHSVKSDVCLYTATPDGTFVIDRLPNSPNVILCSPCSGHGFKHSAAIGESIADLVTDGKSRIDLSAFGLERLALASA